jgi:hypothetical protein
VPSFLADAAGAAAPVFLGGGRNELRPLNLLAPVIFGRFAGGWSSSALLSVVELAAGRSTTILPEPEERSRSFWKCFFEGIAAAGVACWRTVSDSDSESE